MDEEVACIDLSPPDEETGRASLVGVGLWTDISVRVLSLPNLEHTHTEKLLGGNLYLLHDKYDKTVMLN